MKILIFSVLVCNWSKPFPKQFPAPCDHWFGFPRSKIEIFDLLELVPKVHFKNESFPNTEYISKYGLYLPSGLRLSKSKIELICKTLKRILSEK